MTSSLVSIIIPVYNREKYLLNTLTSCLEQTYQNIEIIAIDDGSSDLTWQILTEMASKYPRKIKLIKNTSNQGQCVARNVGLEISSGQYVKFLDSDDILFKDSIQKQLDLLLKTGTDFVVCKSQIFWDLELSKCLTLRDSNEERERYHLYQSFLDLIKSHSFTFNEVLISKSLLHETGGFFARLRAAEEINLLLKIATLYPHTKSVLSEETLLLKRVGYYSLAYQMRNQRETPWLLISLHDASQFYLDNKIINPNLKNYIFNRLYQSSIYAYRNGLKRHSLSSIDTWKKSCLPIPEITPFYHEILHKILGFQIAEFFLEKMRLAKNVFLRNPHQ